MTAAVIDLGTNTFHLIIAELSGSGFSILYKTNVPVQLGEGRINDNIIIPEAFERGIDTLSKFKQIILEHDVVIVKAFATSAVRSASNGNAFVEAAREQAGIDIEIISGDEEADLIFHGVKATGLIQECSLIMDIGGGSTEFIICDKDRLVWKKSYPVGAARLMQKYFHSDPISDMDVADIIAHLDDLLPELKEVLNHYHPTHLIGSAGAFESYAAILQQEFDPAYAVTTEIAMADYQELSLMIRKYDHGQRSQIPGLIPLRVDMIVMASVITDYVIQLGGFSAIKVSTYDLKMGALAVLAYQNFNRA